MRSSENECRACRTQVGREGRLIVGLRLFHAACYPPWRGRPRLAKTIVDGITNDPAAGIVWNDPDVIVTASNVAAVVVVKEFGTDVATPIDLWAKLLSGSPRQPGFHGCIPDEGGISNYMFVERQLLPAERVILDRAWPTLRREFPTAASLTQRVDWTQMTVLRAKAKAEADSQWKLNEDACNALFVTLKKNGLTCPMCGIRGRRFRFIVGHGKDRVGFFVTEIGFIARPSHFICETCGRSFRGSEASSRSPGAEPLH